MSEYFYLPIYSYTNNTTDIFVIVKKSYFVKLILLVKICGFFMFYYFAQFFSPIFEFGSLFGERLEKVAFTKFLSLFFDFLEPSKEV